MPPGAEVEGDDDERDARRHCQGVEDGHGLHRLELEEQVVAPGDRRCQRRGEVDEADGECDRGREARQSFPPADRTERRRPPVQTDPPGGSIAPRGGHDVLPVLRHQPDPERAGEGWDERQSPRVDGETRADEREDAEPEMPFVDPPPEHEDARAEPMAVKANHERQIGAETRHHEGSAASGRPPKRPRAWRSSPGWTRTNNPPVNRSTGALPQSEHTSEPEP